MHSTTLAENFAAARLLDAGGVLEAINDAHRRHGVPVALPTTVNAVLTMYTVLVHAGAAYRSEPCAIARFIALKRAGAVRSQLQECS